MNVLSGVYSCLIMYLDPRGHDSSLRDKNQALGVNLAEFTRATKCYKKFCFGDNSPND